jgi:hypothetical protein
MILIFRPSAAARAEDTGATEKPAWAHGAKKDCDSGPAWCRSGDGSCSPGMRGRCGKRRGDWYGASKPVTSEKEARELLQNYFSGQEYTVAGITEKKWGFKSEILDKNGKVIDKVMIDKRSGRIRSIY